MAKLSELDQLRLAHLCLRVSFREAGKVYGKSESRTQEIFRSKLHRIFTPWQLFYNHGTPEQQIKGVAELRMQMAINDGLCGQHTAVPLKDILTPRWLRPRSKDTPDKTYYQICMEAKAGETSSK